MVLTIFLLPGAFLYFRDKFHVMKHLFCVFFFLVVTSIFTQAQTADSVISKKPSLTWTGFVRADAIFDTRQVVEAREGYLLLYPKNVAYDADGKDFNAKGSFNQYAMTARLAAKIQGPDVFHAKVYAYIEGDFTGASNLENNSFRLRHAYSRLTWKHFTLLTGQFWHPLDLPEMLPNVLSLNTGAPFHSYSRQPQIRTDLTFRHINWVFVASSQRDYVNSGPEKDSSSYIYLKNSMLPNLHSQIQYKGKYLFLGAGIDYKMLVPRLKTDLKYIANEKVNNYAITAFAKVNLKPILIKAQVVYGQSLNDHLLFGGYGVTAIDPSTDHRTYTPLNYFSGWSGISTTGTKLQFSLFVGYTKALGANDSIIAPFVYSRGVDRWGNRKADIDYAYRISPMVTWNVGSISIATELEYTTAAYGPADSRYRIISSKEVSNLRVTASLSYLF